MPQSLTPVFTALSENNTAPLLSWIETRRAEFKKESYEERYQTLLGVAVMLGDPGITGNVDTLDKITMNNVNIGMTAYANEDEIDKAKETLKSEGLENPTNEQVILRLRTDYRGEAPPADEPLKLTLLYDHFRTDGWVVKPEDALIFAEMSANDDQKFGKDIDRIIVGHFGKPATPQL